MAMGVVSYADKPCTPIPCTCAPADMCCSTPCVMVYCNTCRWHLHLAPSQCLSQCACMGHMVAIKDELTGHLQRQTQCLHGSRAAQGGGSPNPASTQRRGLDSKLEMWGTMHLAHLRRSTDCCAACQRACMAPPDGGWSHACSHGATCQEGNTARWS